MAKDERNNWEDERLLKPKRKPSKPGESNPGGLPKPGENRPTDKPGRKPKPR